MIAYQIKANRDDVAEAISLFEFFGGHAADALRVGINKAGPKVRTRSSQVIREDINVKASFLNEQDGSGFKRLDFIRATKAKPEGRIRTPERGLLLSHYEHGAKVSLFGKFLTPPNPIKVKVNPGAGNIKPVEGGSDVQGDPFYIRLKNSGAVGIAMFRKKGSLGKQDGRIKVFYSSSISQAFRSALPSIEPYAAEEYQFQVLDAIRYLLQKQFPQE